MFFKYKARTKRLIGVQSHHVAATGQSMETKIALSHTDKQFTEKKKISICCNDEFIKNHKDRLFNNKQQYPI